MKFSSAVDSLSRENRFLRQIVAILSASSIILGLGVLLLHDKDPVVVERSTRGLEIVRLTPLRRTKEDIDQAVRLMLKARFETAAVSPEVYLSARQLELRASEQAEMKSRGLTQAVIVRSINVKDTSASAEIDRVFALGEVRSALRAEIRLAFESIEPNELNPAGLRLATADPVAPESDPKSSRTQKSSKEVK